ncbi:MAG: tetratricopeptide repeat protein [Desulfuromonadaceae bacterium]|nr:tetratricopeptide repeat protein [Desulfuromonadaceae bacterium]
MIALRRIIPLLLVLMLVGCTVVQPTRPRPVASSSSAVVALLDRAHSQNAAGELEQAGASLERALRIEPHNALLWQELARVRLDLGLYRQAESLAAKSNRFAAGNRTLQGENWRIIGQARSGLGDYRGAQAAFDRAEQE